METTTFKCGDTTVNVVKIDGKPYFHCGNIGKAVGVSNASVRASKLVDTDKKMLIAFPDPHSRPIKTTFLTAEGVSQLLDSVHCCEKEKVEMFKCEMSCFLLAKPTARTNEEKGNIKLTPFDKKLLGIGMMWADFVEDTLKHTSAYSCNDARIELALKATEMLLKNW